MSTYLEDHQEGGRVDLNELDYKQNTPLHYAVRYSHLEVVQLLLSHQARVNVAGSDGMTPVHYSAR